MSWSRFSIESGCRSRCPSSTWARGRARRHRTCSELDDGADRRALVHEVERLVDAHERQLVRDEAIDLDLLVHVPIDDARDVAAPACTAERRALPHATGDELERPRRDFLSRAGDPDDHADA